MAVVKIIHLGWYLCEHEQSGLSMLHTGVGQEFNLLNNKINRTTGVTAHRLRVTFFILHRSDLKSFIVAGKL